MPFGTVLIVDDTTDDVMLLKRAMQKKNYLMKPGTAEELEGLVETLFAFWSINKLPEL